MKVLFIGGPLDGKHLIVESPHKEFVVPVMSDEPIGVRKEWTGPEALGFPLISTISSTSYIPTPMGIEGDTVFIYRHEKLSIKEMLYALIEGYRSRRPDERRY